MNGGRAEISVQAQPRNRAAEDAVAIYRAAVEAVRADRLVASVLAIEGDSLRVGSERLPLSGLGRILVVGAGKASAAMAVAAEVAIGDRLDAGVVVTKHGHMLPTRRIRMMEAGHPVPDAASVEAGRAVYEVAESAEDGDLVICLLSGGASALMELPVEGVSLVDLQATTRTLLRSGADIGEVNTVRACLSRLKAGGLARAAAPARLICLVISDVLGNPLDVIGSGPCLERPVDPVAALEVLRRRGILNTAPKAVRRVLESPRPPALSSGAARRDAGGAGALHIILADIWTALEAARGEASRLGLNPLILTGWMQGEAREAGGFLGAIAKDLPRTARDLGVDCCLAGGETTVTVHGEGKGGRSQELAVAAARAMAGTPDVALLAAGTDGTDGPTEVAGALVDGETVARAAAVGFTVEDALRGNASYPLLSAAGAHVVTGATQTNVNDLVVVVYRREPLEPAASDHGH